MRRLPCQTGRFFPPADPDRCLGGPPRHRRLTGLLGRLLHARTQRDGAASALEALATGVPAARLEPEASPQPTPGRRDRVLAGGERVLIDSLAEKVLHGWLQNRHQTLFPLTVNFRTLTPGQAAALVEWMAVSLLATNDRVDGMPDARAWLASVRAEPSAIALLDSEPPALHHALAAVTGDGLAAYAFIATLIAADPRNPATQPFLDYVAARLGLPTTVVRSAARRYRR